MKLPVNANLAQGTEAWLQWRNRGLGSSDAASIMFEDPNRSPYQLFKQKLGEREKKVNPQMARGNKLEDEARKAYELASGEFLVPACFQHPQHEFLRCSLDGCDSSQQPTVIYEIKCPDYKGDHLTALEGQVPSKYWVQCQHSLMVTGAGVCTYISFWHGETITVLVSRDEAYHKELLAAELAFWQALQDGIFPTPQGEKDLSGDPAWKEAVEDFVQAEGMKKVAEERYARAKAKCARMAKFGRVFGQGVEAKWVFKKGYTTSVSESVFLTVRQIPDKRVD